MGLWTEGWGSLLVVADTSVHCSDGTQFGRKTVSEVVWTLGRGCRNVSGVAGWDPEREDVTQSDLKRELWETPTGESWILWVCVCVKKRALGVGLCGSGWALATDPEDTKQPRILAKNKMTQKTRPPWPKSTHLRVVVEVPQVQAAHAVHGGEHGRMHGRPHDIIHIVGIVLKRVQRFVVLEERGREKIRR